MPAQAVFGGCCRFARQDYYDSMIATVLGHSDMDPTVVVVALWACLVRTARLGKSDLIKSLRLTKAIVPF